MKQYNVNIVGNLTNDNGVLSGFSAGNYATLSKTFNPPSQIALEIVFKFNSNSISDEQIIFQMGNISTANGFIDIEVYNSKLYFELDSENTQRCYIEGITTLSSNTDYWIKLVYDGVNTYSLYLSTDGITWNLEGTVTSWYYLINAQNSYIGINQDLSQWYFNGSIDLNKSYINTDGDTWWQGVENITRIQLRHDTAANWTSVNPILLEGEVGIETDTRKQKFGDGSTAWNSLPYDKGSTALQSITSSDVTNALGYTPVNKAGDIMTGSLRIETAVSDDSIILKNTSDNTSSLPSTNQLRSFRAVNDDGTILGDTRFIHNANGSVSASLLSRNYLTGSLVQASIEVRISASGVASCTFPNTTCCDGQWVVSSSSLASSVSLAIGNNQTLEYDLSSYLPSDSYKYEVLVSVDAQTGNSSGAGLAISLRGKGTSNGSDLWYRICDTYARGSWYMNIGNHAVVPIGTDRKLVLNYTVVSKAATLNNMFVEGYRRIGTNSQEEL